MSSMPPLTRRLSSRRGSASATHATLDHPVQASSTLTIVRVISPPPQPDPVPVPLSPRRIHHRRLPSHPPSAPDRISFATSSFGPASPSPTPSSPPRARPSSPHRLSANLPLPSVPHLSPDQLVDLARSSTHQRALPAAGHDSPQLRASSPSDHRHGSTAPATFTPLPDDILLPFINRPSEVAALISTPPSAKLFSLLEKTLAPITEPSSHPSKWTYSQLHDHLTLVSRQRASDAIWVLQARRCIISHSELIWERVKGALGVPPELDVDYDPSEPFSPVDPYEYDCSSSHSSSIDTDEISDDHGRSARGHWEDWDAIMDSPVYARRHSGPGSPVLPLSLSRQEDNHSHHPEASGATSLFSPEHRPVSPSTFLSIEPLLESSQAHASATAETAGLGLDDIQEGAEEEESTADDTSTEKEPDPDPQPKDPHLIAPSQIQGLRISTTPITLPDLSSSNSGSALPSSPLASTSTFKPLSPISPLPPYTYPASAPRSGPVFRRSGSFGSMRGTGDYASGEGLGDGYASDGSGHVPGSPLFPSNFARLSVEPTLGYGHHGESVSAGKNLKQRRSSHGSASGGSVAGYKRLSWGATPAGQ